MLRAAIGGIEMAHIKSVKQFEGEILPITNKLRELHNDIRRKCEQHANGRYLKGNEIVAWLGEIYVKLLLGGHLADESEEHDVLATDGKRISVKTRKGTNSGWRRTSSIPRISGPKLPTHLAFVHLSDTYGLDRIWLLPWRYLKNSGRFKQKNIRGSKLDYYIYLDERRDAKYLIYPL